MKEIADRFVEAFDAETSMQDASALLSKAIKTANLKILGHASTNPEYAGMGTTVVAFVCRGNELLLANVGDSRAYFVGEEIKQLTKDHSLVQELISCGKITLDDAKKYPQKIFCRYFPRRSCNPTMVTQQAVIFFFLIGKGLILSNAA